MFGHNGILQNQCHQDNLQPVRCIFCNRLLFRGAVEKIEIKCPKCSTVQVFQRDSSGWIHHRDLSHHRLKTQSSYNKNERITTDSTGRLVAIPKHPQRVVILNSSNLNLYIATGGRPVGRGSNCLVSASFQEKLAHIPTVGPTLDPNLKCILAANPDLIIGMAIPEHRSLAAILESKGIPVVLQTFTSYADVLNALRFYGELNAHEDLAAKRIAVIEKYRLDLLSQKFGYTAPRVLIIWKSTTNLYAALSASFIGDLVRCLGGVNIYDMLAPSAKKSMYIPLDFKQAATLQPDVVLFIDHSFGLALNQHNPSSSDFQWEKLLAVQNNKVYCLPNSVFTASPGAQVDKALHILADCLYGPSVDSCFDY